MQHTVAPEQRLFLLSKKSRRELSAAVLATLALGCVATVQTPDSAPTLTVVLSRTEFFEAEPIYVVFRLTNERGDTAWVNRFSIAERNLHVILTRSGEAIPDNGLVVDYIRGPSWRGVPVASHESLFDAVTLQTRWGFRDSAFRNLYAVGPLPRGSYELRAIFDWTPNGSPKTIASETTTFRIRSRAQIEQREADSVIALENLAWDLERRAEFLPATLNYAEQRAKIDSLDPFLPLITSHLAGTARAIGSPPDSSSILRLCDLLRTIALTRRNDPAGVIALLALFNEARGEAIRSVQMAPASLVKDVGLSLVAQSP